MREGVQFAFTVLQSGRKELKVAHLYFSVVTYKTAADILTQSIYHSAFQKSVEIHC